MMSTMTRRQQQQQQQVMAVMLLVMLGAAGQRVFHVCAAWCSREFASVVSASAALISFQCMAAASSYSTPLHHVHKTQASTSQLRHNITHSTARVLASQAEAIVRTGKHGHNIE